MFLGIKTKGLVRFNRVFCALFLMGLNSGCGVEFKSARPNGSSGELNKSGFDQLNHGVSINLQGMEIYKYKANINWAGQYDRVRIYVGDSLAFESNSSKINGGLIELNHDSDNVVRAFGIPSGSKSTNNNELIFERKIHTPLDIDLAQWIEENKGQESFFIRSHRVFLNENSEVITGGKDLLVDTNDLISQNGVLSTFPANQKAIVDQKGRGGGSIRIKAHRASGELHINMFGEYGGDGSDGKPYTQPAKRGKNAASLSEFDPTVMIPPIVFLCLRPLDRGGIGENGAEGRPGSPGRQGGNSGEFKIEVYESSPEFIVLVNKKTGIAGKPGKGGPGQPGGEGGLGDVAPEWCPQGRKGAKGLDGKNGADGISEGDGIIQDECISIGEGFGRCS